MSNGNGGGVLVELNAVREELAAWRTNPGKSRAIPDTVWRQAVTAAKKHGINPVSKALGLDYTYLKRRMSCRGVNKRKTAELVPTFVEVWPETKAQEAACVIELEKGGGTRMRICVKSANCVDWRRIKEAFLGA